MALVIESIGGVCPTQAEGEMDGHPFYFRARHGNWDLCVVKPGADPVMPQDWNDVVLHRSGNDPTDGWMEIEDVKSILQSAYDEIRNAAAR